MRIFDGLPVLSFWTRRRVCVCWLPWPDNGRLDLCKQLSFLHPSSTTKVAKHSFWKLCANAIVLTVIRPVASVSAILVLNLSVSLYIHTSRVDHSFSIFRLVLVRRVTAAIWTWMEVTSKKLLLTRQKLSQTPQIMQPMVMEGRREGKAKIWNRLSRPKAHRALTPVPAALSRWTIALG